MRHGSHGAIAALTLSLMGLAARAECPPGGRCPKDPNARGIYTASVGGNYCLRLDPGTLFCPEAFETVDGELRLTGSRVESEVRDGTVTHGGEQTVSLKVEGTLDGKRVSLTGVNVSGFDETRGNDAYIFPGPPHLWDHASRLIFLYKRSTTDKPHRVAGRGLEALRLQVSLPESSLELRFREVAPKGALIYRYDASYWIQGRTGHLCESNSFAGRWPERSVVALPGTRVDGMTARVSFSHDVATLACGAGAIASCVERGYASWNPRFCVGAGCAGPAIGACINARRGAYFARLNDFHVYPRKGQLLLQDIYSIQPVIPEDFNGFLLRGPVIGREELGPIEAIWDERGALCFIPRNRRGGAFTEDLPRELLSPAPPWGESLCESPAEFEAGTRPGQLPDCRCYLAAKDPPYGHQRYTSFFSPRSKWYRLELREGVLVTRLLPVEE